MWSKVIPRFVGGCLTTAPLAWTSFYAASHADASTGVVQGWWVGASAMFGFFALLMAIATLVVTGQAVDES